MPEQDVQKTISELERRLNDLEEKNKSFEKEFNGVVRIKGGELIIGGGKTLQGVPGGFQSPLTILDDPGIDSSKMGLGLGATISNRDTVNEQIVAGIVAQKIDKKESIPNAGLSNQEGTKRQDFNLMELLLYHNSKDVTTFNSFFFGLRNPIIIGNGMVANGGSTITDLTLELKTDELAGSFIYLEGSSQECFEILSNTGTVITIDGTWASDSNEYVYQVDRPVYLGAANGPWRRLYVQDDIRFGIGPSNGTKVVYIKFGLNSPEGVVTARPGSLYMDRGGGEGATLYIKEGGAGNTGWVANGLSLGSQNKWIKWGAGDPEGSVSANVGSIYLNTGGGAGTVLYVKESGTGATGWGAK